MSGCKPRTAQTVLCAPQAEPECNVPQQSVGLAMCKTGGSQRIGFAKPTLTTVLWRTTFRTLRCFGLLQFSTKCLNRPKYGRSDQRERSRKVRVSCCFRCLFTHSLRSRLVLSCSCKLLREAVYTPKFDLHSSMYKTFHRLPGNCNQRLSKDDGVADLVSF